MDKREAKAYLRYVRIAPRKVQIVCDLIRGKDAAAAMAILMQTNKSAPFQIFAALNVNAPNFAKQLELAREKEEAGAAGFLTQPVHSPRALDNLARAREALNGYILGGVFPIVSHRNALFLNNEVAGVSVPEEIVARYEGLDREAAEALALELSVKTARDMAPCTDGWYLMTPFRRVGLVARILAQLRERE